jgi:hypothetical protein
VNRLTSSSIARAVKCGWWAKDWSPLPMEFDSEASEAGRATHALIDDTIKTGDESHHGDELHATWLSDWWLDEWHRGWKSEVAFAMDLATGETMVIEGRGREAYADMPADWPKGTADAILVVDEPNERVGYVEDWKTGLQAGTDPAVSNLQVRFIAAALARHFRCDRVVVGICKLRGDHIHRTRASLDLLDLEVFRAELRELVASLPSAEPKPGPHCRLTFCPAFGTTCPKTSATLPRAVPEVAAATMPIVFDWKLIRDNRHAAELLGVAYAIKNAAASLWEVLGAYAAAKGPIQLAGNRRWGFRKTRPTDRIKAPLSAEAMRAIIAVLGAPGEEAIDRRTSKKALGFVAGKLALAGKARGEKVTKKAILGSAVEALRAVGAVETKSTEKRDEWIEGEKDEPEIEEDEAA